MEDIGDPKILGVIQKNQKKIDKSVHVTWNTNVGSLPTVLTYVIQRKSHGYPFTKTFTQKTQVLITACTFT